MDAGPRANQRKNPPPLGEKYMIKKLAFTLGIICGIMQISFASPLKLWGKPVKQVSNNQVELSREFLLSCDFFNKFWPEAAQKLKTEEFRVLIPGLVESGICARFVELTHARIILMFPDMLHHPGCYDGNPMETLSHEMLHQVGLPPHRPRSEVSIDPIEITMAMCHSEAVNNKRRISWEQK